VEFGSKLWGRRLFISFGAEAQGQGLADEPVIGLVFSIQRSACRLWLDVGQSKLKKEIDVTYLLILTTHQDAEWAVVVGNLHAMGVGGAQWSLAVDFATSNMATKRTRQPKDHQCLQCHRLYTAKNIGTHTQNCTKWDTPGGGTSSRLISQLGEQSDDDSIIEEVLQLSEIPLDSHSDPRNHQSPASFGDFGLNDNAVLLQDILEADTYQDKQAYDSEEDEYWRNEFCVLETEPLQEIDEDEAEELKISLTGSIMSSIWKWLRTVRSPHLSFLDSLLSFACS